MITFTGADLEAMLLCAEHCDSAAIPGDQFRALMDLAIHAKGFAIANINRLRSVSDRDQVRLSGTEFRALLMLAMRAKKSRAATRPHFRIVS